MLPKMLKSLQLIEAPFALNALLLRSMLQDVYDSIGRTMTAINMHYGSFVMNFKITWNAYEATKRVDLNIFCYDDFEVIRNLSFEVRKLIFELLEKT